MTSTTSEQSTSVAAGTLAWWEIPVVDLGAAKTFYTTVFGWTYQDFGDGYSMISSGDQTIGGLTTMGAEHAADGCRLYIQVDDLEATLATAKAAGGSVFAERTHIGDGMGYWAMFADDQGRHIGVVTDNDAA